MGTTVSRQNNVVMTEFMTYLFSPRVNFQVSDVCYTPQLLVDLK